MREMARRLNSTQYVLIGVLLGTCIYLWGRKFTVHLRGQTNGSITNRPHLTSSEAGAVEDVENLIDSWANNKKEEDDEVNIKRKNAEVEESADVILERGSKSDQSLLVQSESSVPALLPDVVPEKEERILVDVQAKSKDMRQDIADELNKVDDVELMNSISNTLRENDLKKENDESTSSGNDVEVPSIMDSYESQSPSSISQSNENIGIKHFAPMKTTPLGNDDNKTLQLLDLWNFDEKCAGFQVGLLKDNSLERRALVSFPGSGNSWLRMLIQGVSGVFVDSIYPDGEDNLFHSKANSTYQVPIDCGCTLLQKTHDFSLDAMLYYLPEANRTQTLNEFEGKGILILRNPFSSIRSYRNFDSGGMQGMAPDTAFKGKEWDNFVGRSVAGWETLANVWIRGLKQGGIIYYEKLRHEMPSELARLSKMLGLIHNQERLDCVIRHANDNSFKRDSVNKTIEDPYTASQRLLIHKAIESVQAVLKERGLDPLPTQYYDFFSVVPEYGIPSNSTHD